MKYAIVLCDGMADRRIAQLGNSTPMEKAHKPAMDMLASKSEVGLVKTVPDSLPPGSDVANLAILGYDPEEAYTGRSALEAAGMGISLKPTDVTFRCNLVTLSEEACYEDKTLIDYCSGDISTEESHVLINYLKEYFDSGEFCLYPGVSYRHCLIWDNGDPKPGELTPPHDITGKCIKEYIPSGRSTDILYKMMKKSYELLKDH
ncbi:MAG: phosphoglycerate mutase, partial [Firmicutes bacterium]|nr:phosphoglycerate mutase [Bacillota bacterium]